MSNQWRGVVKVQRNLFSTHAEPGTLVLITSQDGSVRWEGPIDHKLLEWFHPGEHKFFAHAELRGTVVHLRGQARSEDW